MTFQDIIAQAKLHSPGGRLDSEDLVGLRIRGAKMGHSADEIDRIIAETPSANRVALPQEQWK